MTDLPEADRAQILALLEQHHGVGARGGGGLGWLTQRLSVAVRELATSRGLDAAQVVDLLRSDPAELAALADALRVGETCLYRDPPQWNALHAHLDAQDPRSLPRLRGLSVGCSTGEEAWTLAMVFDGTSRGRPWRVVGVDRSEPAIAVAQAGTYPESSARHVPPELRHRYLAAASAAPPLGTAGSALPSAPTGAALPLGPGGSALQVAPALAEHVWFQVRDATTGLPPGSYEVVVCKNVLIYFGEQAGAKLVAALMRALAPGGVLIVARSEVPRLRALGYEGRAVTHGVTFFG